MGAPRHRLVLIGSDLELRIVSIIVRARESVDEVVLLDRGSSSFSSSRTIRSSWAFSLSYDR